MMRIGIKVRSSIQFNKNRKELIEKINSSLVNAKCTKDASGDDITTGYLDWLFLVGITDKVVELKDEDDVHTLPLGEYAEFFKAYGLDANGGKRLSLVKIRERGIMYEVNVATYGAPIVVRLSKLYPDVRFRVSDTERHIITLYPSYDVYYIENGVVEGEKARKHAEDYIRLECYSSAMATLLPFALAGDDKAMNDIGVCLEKMEKYDEASKWYEKSNLELAKENLLLQYDNKRISLNVEKYTNACNYLVERRNPKGYLYLSYLYQREDSGLANKKNAIGILNKGLKQAYSERLVFEKAYLLNLYNRDLKESHKLYRKLLTSDDGFTKTARYNYALQCWTGRGCKKNVTECIVWLTIAAMDGYRDAFTKLIELYETEKGYMNKKQVEVWKTLKDIYQHGYIA